MVSEIMIEIERSADFTYVKITMSLASDDKKVAMARISTIIPTYNRAKVVGDAIESVLSQTRPADEIIVVDDGSTDTTVEILQHYIPRITLITQKNRGVSAARNRGLSAASGEWITFLDSDDIWRPDRLEVLARDLPTHDVGVHLCGCIFTGPGYNVDFFLTNGFEFSLDSADLVKEPLALALCPPQIGSVAVRRDWLNKVGHFDEGMLIAEDRHLLCKLSLQGLWMVTGRVGVEVRRIPQSGGFLSSQIQSNPLYTAEMRVKLFSELAAHDGLKAALRSLIARKYSAATFDLSCALWDAGDRSSARRALLQSARLHPSLKGWVRVLGPFLLGRRGYDLVPRKTPRFLRSQHEDGQA